VAFEPEFLLGRKVSLFGHIRGGGESPSDSPGDWHLANPPGKVLVIGREWVIKEVRQDFLLPVPPEVVGFFNPDEKLG